MASSAPAWATELRGSAEETFATLPALTGREEAWRFTEPSALALDGADTPAPGRVTQTTEPLGGDRAGRLQFVDGAPAAPELAADLPAGVVIGELSEALITHEELVRERLLGLIGADDRPGALNAARWQAGTFVYVPRGVELTTPVEALLSATGAQGHLATRTLVVLDEGAKATVIDRFASPDLPGTVQASSAVELYVGPNAELEHLTVVEWGAGVHHHSIVRARAERDSRVRSVVVTIGGDVVRIEPTMLIEGSGVDARALGLYFAGGNQHFEHRVEARHHAPQSYSNLLYKGAIQGTAHTVFYGNLIVPPGAPGTDAYQTNRNLLLNNGARAETIPFLEIETADVKCSHAGAVVQVDDQHLFYLQARGIPEADAKRLVVMGFMQEVIEHVHLPELRAELEAAVAAKLR